MFWSITAFYAGEFLTLVLSITALRILSSSISAYQVSVRPIILQQNFLSTWFKVEGQVVERWERHLRTSCSQCHSHLDPTTEPGMSSQHTRHALETEEEWKMAAHAETCRTVGVLFVPLVMEFLGGWSDEATHTIVSIGRLQGRRLGIPPSEIRHVPLPATGHLAMANAHCGSAASQSILPTWTG